MKYALGLLALLLLGALSFFVFVRRDHRAVPGEEQLYDDTAYAVRSAETRDGRLAVGIEVLNHAKRIHIRPATFRARLVDAKGGVHEELAQLATHPREDLGPGESVVEQHFFEPPPSATGLVLELSFGSIPDALDWFFLGQRSWRLP